MSECAGAERQRGLVIPCMIFHMDNITSRRCHEVLNRLQPLVFSNYQLVYKFVEHCDADIKRLHCGRTDSGRGTNRVHVYTLTLAKTP